MEGGRRFGGPPNPYQPPDVPAGKVNITDPDSKPIPIGFGFVQGYNAQAAVNEQQIVVAAEITNNSTDFFQLDPMVTATLDELEKAGIEQLPEAVAADAGYWNEEHIDEVEANKHIPVLVAPDKGSRGSPRKTWTGGRYEFTCERCSDQSTGTSGIENANRPPSRRSATPNTTTACTGFTAEAESRRGSRRLLMMTHNLIKVHRHQRDTTGA